MKEQDLTDAQKWYQSKGINTRVDYDKLYIIIWNKKTAAFEFEPPVFIQVHEEEVIYRATLCRALEN
jgi:hypothetical protein